MTPRPRKRKKCMYARLIPTAKSSRLKCWPDDAVYEDSGYCKKHLMIQEVHADKFGKERP